MKFKPRNPDIVPMLKRKSGPHGQTTKAKRKRDNDLLKSNLNRSKDDVLL